MDGGDREHTIPPDLEARLVEELTLEADEGVVRPIACEIRAGSLHHDFDAYAAIEKIEYKGGREVWGAVILIDVSADSGSGYCFKTLHELEGPIYYDCPLHILDLLPPTDDEWANTWRGICRERQSIESITSNPSRG